MKIVALLVFPFFVFAPLVPCSAQSSKTLPNDLSESKVIFLEYEHIHNNYETPYAMRKKNNYRNTLASKANHELRTEAKYYPFEYKVAKRSDYKNLMEKGYDYILENDMMEAYNNGEQVDAGANKIYSAPMYLLHIKTGIRYELFDVKQTAVYEYGKIIRRFCKLVKDEFN